MLVVDSSVLLSALLPDEQRPDLEKLFAAHDEIIAPSLLWVELRNIVLSAERRKRLDRTMADALLDTLDDLAISLDHSPDSERVLRLARRHDLTAYDALYLELALRTGSTLATLDKALRRAAKAEALSLAP
ncbi:MAG: type II toxin-antitoxin system VapC family toxin [Tessaracoccus sp.]